MKRMLSIMLIVLLIGVFSACGQRDESAAAASEAAASEATESEVFEEEEEVYEEASLSISESSMEESNDEELAETLTPEPTIEPTSEPEPEIEKVNLLNDADLVGAMPFYDDIAWIQYYDERGEVITSALRRDGEVLFSLEEEIYYCSRFFNGEAFYVTENCEVIVDINGNELYRTKNTMSNSAEEVIVCNGPNGFIVCKYFTGIEGEYYELYKIDSRGNVLDEFPDSFPKMIGREWNKTNHINGNYISYNGKGYNEYTTEYAGTCIVDDIYYVPASSHVPGDGFYIDFSTKTVVEGSAPSGDCWEGKIMTCTGDILDTNLEIIGHAKIKEQSQDSSEGVYYSNEEQAYYNFSGEEVISLNFYPDLSKQGYAFHDGYAIVTIYGKDRENYVTVIDTSGDMLFEPIQYSSFSAYIVDGAFLISDGSEVFLYNIQGEKVHSVSKDIEYIGGELDYYNWAYGNYWAADWTASSYDKGTILCYKSGGELMYAYYDYSAATEAGDTIYQLKKPVEDMNDDGVLKKDYIYIPGLSIEGKWKNVGEDTYGQAQAGAIIVFDGSKCNFFSPSDTYAFYEEGDNYRLDCTSPLADTVSFTVKIVDEDNIDILFSGGIVELTRIE